MVLCPYDCLIKSKERDLFSIRGKKRSFLINGDVTFDLFESQIGRISGSESSSI